MICPHCHKPIDGQPLPITEGQQRAWHAKLQALARILDTEKAAIRDLTLALASRKYGRTIQSSRDLLSHEAGWLLDHLDERIEHGNA